VYVYGKGSIEMLLKSLHLKNIKNHSDYKIDFTDGITAIIGKNGKGKSTILESIGFVLFDYLPYKQKEFITHGKTWGEIELIISKASDPWNIIIKRRIGNNPHYMITSIDGQIIGKEDVQQWIKDNLNIDMDLERLYSEILAIPQGMATAHFLLPKTQRAQIFDSIMGVDIYRKCWSKLSPVEKLLKKQITSIEKDIAILKNETKDYNTKRDEYYKLNEEIEELKKEVVSAEEQRDKLEVEFTDLNEMAGWYDEKENKEYQLQQIITEISEFELKRNKIDEDKKKKLELIIKNSKDIVKKYNDTYRKVDELAYNIKYMENNIEDTSEAIDEFKSQMKGYNDMKDSADELDYVTEMKEKWNEDIIIAQTELDRLYSIGNDGKCLFTKETCDKINIKVIDTNIEMWRERLQDARDKFKELDHKYWECKHARDIVDKLEDRKKQIEKDKVSLRDYVTLLEKMGKEHDEASSLLSELSSKLDKYDKAKIEYDEIKSKSEQNMYIEGHLEFIKKDYKKFKAEIAEYDTKLVGFDADRLDIVYDEMNKKNAYLSTIQERCSQKALQGVIAYKEISALEKKFSKLTNSEGKLKKINETLEKTKKIRDIFSKVGSKLTNSYLRNISYTANQIYQELMNTTETLSWETNYEVKVEDKKFNQLSGGQQMSAAISVRLALLKYFSNINLIILDEPTANLDDTRREALAESIQKLENKNQILVVTHDDTFSTMTDNVIVL
jgi:exonuclease SbcC